jgi:hypothetical protein
MPFPGGHSAGVHCESAALKGSAALGTVLAIGLLRAGPQPVAKEHGMKDAPPLSHHAVQRSRTRRIEVDAIATALAYGRARCVRGAEICTLGWREVRYWAGKGVDLARFEGVEVVCSHDGSVITVYRNRKPASIRDRELRRAA